ncbi:MAG: ACP S-malonyltransferase [Candidatus Thiodiazotropha sp. (ex Lucina aurantia)]|uniref:Malonyl CoA-acyl carrier protein transacylase n=2 Tax=Candidatus Thiodiazotropha TaxID=1913444 RepID=A0A7Z1AEL8_9GAMM|nr:ACP S-malonyltransferase [Candidatus Thiodiazotropha endolucinida]MBT3012898.1 ACP S-malonyltransferase [Candidatus Thiodiazotropha sp. (ex Lucina pensylvanica)]MBT3017670.1 ACP S-malonyltransferase [Candidatus Thiodiazotropha taylori]MBT3040396.1 ACP S-malonyltransferase [Candidatus Thiodiazotropha sp. (ex Codakia orbicularis)]MBV2104301.1 ACP S-malonyltransferase [Candidatus Thiodiazotropha sp. (ex Lucina aurantia)]MBT3024556.1 ACP S-malonyltransferase [Candidatus Thiodiazotropha taylori]
MTNSSFGIVFPGQGSQSVGMLSELAAAHPIVSQTFAEATDALGYDLWELVQNGPNDALNQTTKTQPAMLAAGVSVWRVWLEQGGAKPQIMAGHSLGEYTALVCADAIEFADAVRLVAERGRFMQEAVPEGSGGMAAILGLDDVQVKTVCAEAASGDVIEAVNFNSPGQVVVAGHKEAVDRACVLAKEAGAKRALPLPVSVPSHCALMKPAAERLAQLLNEVGISQPSISVIHNASVAAATDAESIRKQLAAQLYSPVRWVETVQMMATSGISSLLEAGPGKVLAGLTKRIDRGLVGLPVFDAKSLMQALETLK